jgi:hypothetical protein
MTDLNVNLERREDVVSKIYIIFLTLIILDQIPALILNFCHFFISKSREKKFQKKVPMLILLINSFHPTHPTQHHLLHTVVSVISILAR